MSVTAIRERNEVGFRDAEERLRFMTAVDVSSTDSVVGNKVKQHPHLPLHHAAPISDLPASQPSKPHPYIPGVQAHVQVDQSREVPNPTR